MQHFECKCQNVDFQKSPKNDCKAMRAEKLKYYRYKNVAISKSIDRFLKNVKKLKKETQFIRVLTIFF